MRIYTIPKAVRRPSAAQHCTRQCKLLAKITSSLSLPKHRKCVLFRPYRRATARWASVTYSEFDQALGSATECWSAKLPVLGLVPGDVVGCWFVTHASPRLARCNPTQLPPPPP